MTNFVKVKIEITDEMIDDILAGCFEGGSNYWITSVELKRQAMEGRNLYNGYASHQISRGGLLWIHYDGESMSLTKNKVVLGCRKYAQHHGKFDFENFDADDCDQILQYALFSEIVYG